MRAWHLTYRVQGLTGVTYSARGQIARGCLRLSGGRWGPEDGEPEQEEAAYPDNGRTTQSRPASREGHRVGEERER